MKKLTLEVYLPAALRTFDVQVSAAAPLSQVVELTAKAMAELAEGLYIADPPPVICDRETGCILNINMTVWELGLRNGSRLMLI